MANWSDLAEFEADPVMTSKEAAETIAPETLELPLQTMRGRTEWCVLQLSYSVTFLICVAIHSEPQRHHERGLRSSIPTRSQQEDPRRFTLD